MYVCMKDSFKKLHDFINAELYNNNLANLLLYSIFN